MYDQVVESCDCVEEQTECSDARVQGEERIQQVSSVAGNASEQTDRRTEVLYENRECIHA